MTDLTDAELRSGLSELAERHVAPRPDHGAIRSGMRSRRRFRRAIIALAAAGTVGTAVVSTGLLSRSTEDATGVTPVDGRPAQTADRSGTHALTQMSERVRKSLAIAGVEVHPVDAADPAVTAEEAVAAASRDFGSVTASPANVSATLARVTTHEFGTELGSDPGAPSTIDPRINDELVWVVVFTNVRIIDEGVGRPRAPDVAPSARARHGTVVQIVGSDKASVLFGLTI